MGGIYGSQLYKGHFNLGLSLFGIPFILGTVVLGSVALMAVCGKVVVRVDGDEGSIFTGFGPFGWCRRFDWQKVTAIRRTERYGSRGSILHQITLEGDKRLNFSAGASIEQLDYVFATLRGKWRESGHYSSYSFTPSGS